MRAKVFKFCIHLESGQVYCGKKSRCWDKVLPYFSISHSTVIYREICVKDSSKTTAARILKFGTNVGYDLLYCVRENQPPALTISFIFPFFFLSNQIFCYRFLSFYESQSSNFLCTLRVTKYIVGQKTKMLRFILSSLSIFPISHSV